MERGLVYLVELVLTCRLMNEYERVSFPLIQSFRATLGASGVAAVVWFVGGPSLLMIMIGVLVGAAVYVGLLVLLRGYRAGSLTLFARLSSTDPCLGTCTLIR